MDTAISPVFAAIFAILIGEEGGLSREASDPGNWTGGRIGVGNLAGTKYGISAAAYPDVDIVGLTLNAARAIYVRDYWDQIEGDDVPPQAALILFDSAVNNGVSCAVEYMQMALGVKVDGVLGDGTRTARVAAVARDARGFAVEVLARRIDAMGNLSGWEEFGLGWSRRVAALPWKAMSLSHDLGAIS
jgi:lysozyme family protein